MPEKALNLDFNYEKRYFNKNWFTSWSFFVI